LLQTFPDFNLEGKVNGGGIVTSVDTRGEKEALP